MTGNQINYAKHLEDVRHNLAMEEINRSQARSAERQAGAAETNAATNQANANVNYMNALTNARNADTNWQNVLVSANAVAVNAAAVGESARHNAVAEEQNAQHLVNEQAQATAAGVKAGSGIVGDIASMVRAVSAFF